MSARELRAEPYPTFKGRAPRHGCQPCLRGSRPSSRVSSPLSLSASRLGGTHSTRTVRPPRSCRAPATVAASWFRVRSEDGATTALHRRPGKEGPAPVPRGTGGLPPSPGLSSDGWTAAPSRLAGEPVQSQPHAPRACTPPSQGEKILSARRAGQAGRRAGSGKTIPRLARGATLPSREAVRRAPPTHARLAATPRKTRGRPLTRLPSGPRDGVASHSGAE